jgi:hypothetical protein
MLDYLGVDPATFDVATFEDTLSPKLAHDLGLISKRPTTEIVVAYIASSTYPSPS